MAIFELQFRQDVFFDIVRAEVIRIPVPSTVLDGLAALGSAFGGQELLIERIEVNGVNAVERSPNFVPTRKGQLMLQIDAEVFLTTFQNAKTAGSLQPPIIVTSVPATIWLTLTLDHEKVLSFAVVDSDQGFTASGTWPLDLLLPFEMSVFWA